MVQIIHEQGAEDQCHFTAQGVPVLSVHDSFIVDYTRVGELKQAMALASEAALGACLKTSNAFIGLDEDAGAISPSTPPFYFITYIYSPLS